MCGRFTLTDADGARLRFDIRGADMPPANERANGTSDAARYNIAPTQDVLTIRNEDGERRAEMMRWGLVPSWADSPKVGARMINARAETRGVPQAALPDSGGWVLRMAARGQKPRPDTVHARKRRAVRVRGLVGAMGARGRAAAAVLRHRHRIRQRADSADTRPHAGHPSAGRRARLARPGHDRRGRAERTSGSVSVRPDAGARGVAGGQLAGE